MARGWTAYERDNRSLASVASQVKGRIVLPCPRFSGRTPSGKSTDSAGVIGLVVLLSSEEVAFLRLTGVSGRDSSLEMEMCSDILAT